MTSYMQEHARNLVDILRYSARIHGDVEVVTRRVEDGGIHRASWCEIYRRVCRLAHALTTK
jgi:acyl-CoA synthetase (AMP-forming)/AMP-acid ligase II